ncbi:MAG: GtrA family protein [Clostridia bacterium]|nr:GtrA family protein [Clostridia bacterium]
MKEFFSILFSFDFKKIFCTPTNNGLLQFFRYAFVGGWATIADWGVFALFNEIVRLHYLISAPIAFLMGLTVNYLLSKKFVFSKENSDHSASTEFIVYGIIGIIGLLMTMVIMWVLTEFAGFLPMISKIIATAIVLVWNFLARKVVLYK